MAKRMTAAERRKVAQDDSEVRKLLKQLARLPVHATPVVHDDVPTMVARVEQQSAESGQSYEEANWPRLSPMFRRSHNQLRVMRGLPPIPEPKIDLYVAPPSRKIEKVDETNADSVAAMRQFLRGGLMAPGSQGFQDKGLGKEGWIE